MHLLVSWKTTRWNKQWDSEDRVCDHANLWFSWENESPRCFVLWKCTSKYKSLTSELQKFVKCLLMGMLICVANNVLTKF